MLVKKSDLKTLYSKNLLFRLYKEFGTFRACNKQSYFFLKLQLPSHYVKHSVCVFNLVM